MRHLLDNIVWHTLSGPHAPFSDGTHEAKRYAQGFSPILGFANPDLPNFRALEPFCSVEEHLYCGGWAGAAPAGWQIKTESTMFQMVWEAAVPGTDAAPEAVRLAGEHAEAALELATLTRPGPFGPRTIELGDYFGFFEGPRLIAMAGERLCAGPFREISGVCTHPDFQGRRFARRLMLKLIRRQMLRNETPFLHVMSDNSRAHELYQRMGFRLYRESVVRVVSRY
jgi:ribosomal protein S18 acetylase RimI-like enzyme